ncbi:MAG: cysteine hydrolase family protein [Ectobacillus sp.]
MGRALIHIDYTYDFVAKDGALTCGTPAQEIEDKLALLTEEFIQNGDYVVFAVDMHEKNDPYHPEAALFPPHNIVKTNGRQLYGKLQGIYETYKEKQNVYYMDKTRYSAFAGTNLEIKLRERAIDELYLVGVCTDICVLHTAIDAYNKGFKIIIYRDMVASFSEQGHEWALQHFLSCLGAEVR